MVYVEAIAPEHSHRSVLSITDQAPLTPIDAYVVRVEITAPADPAGDTDSGCRADGTHAPANVAAGQRNSFERGSRSLYAGVDSIHLRPPRKPAITIRAAASRTGETGRTTAKPDATAGA